MNFACSKSMNIMDCPEFRDLLLYISQECSEDEEIPHRTKLTELIGKRFKEEYIKMVECLCVSPIDVPH